VPPPGGPAVIGVTEVSYRNATVQNVILAARSATSGQNEFVIRVFQGGRTNEETGTLSDSSLTPDRISEELEERFPGVDMQVSLAYTQNKYGPFGFASGSPGNGDRCLYAWQRLENTERSLFSPTEGAVSIRLRLCEAGKSVTELLRTAYGFTITGSSRGFGWNPLGEPPGPSPALGATSVPLYPVAPRGTFDDVVPSPSERARPARRVSRPAAAPRRDVEPGTGAEPLPGFPTVPGPDGGTLRPE
jgi:hypothetical protein